MIMRITSRLESKLINYVSLEVLLGDVNLSFAYHDVNNQCKDEARFTHQAAPVRCL